MKCCSTCYIPRYHTPQPSPNKEWIAHKMVTLPVDIWRAEIWERGLDDDAVTIARYSMVCKESNRMYKETCRRMKVPPGWCCTTNQRQKKAGMGGLPRELKYLHTGGDQDWRDECVPNLPPNLEQLTMLSTGLTNACVARLPRSLVYLNLHNCLVLSDACVKDLPHGLKYLNATCWSLSPRCIADLPAGLKVFKSCRPATVQAWRDSRTTQVVAVA